MMSILRRLSFWLVLAGIGLATIGARWETIARFGHDVPVMDEWDGMGLGVLRPWRHGTLNAWDVFWQPHNEHRIGWTRLWALATTGLNGQWDPVFDTSLNTLLYAAFAVGLLLAVRNQLEGPAWWLVPAGLAATACVPLSWENTLHPFQIQFLFLIASGLLHVVFLACSPLGSRRWWIGMSAGLFGLGSMATSFVAPFVVIAIRVLRAGHARKWTRDETITVTACTLIGIVGAAGIAPVSHHAALHAGSVTAFLGALTHMAAFPAPGVWPLALVLQAPAACWIALRLIRFRSDWTHADWAFLGLVAWIALQCGALAYSRGSVNHGISSRYADLFGLLLVANPLALGLLWRGSSGRSRQAVSVLACMWAIVAFWGGARLARFNYDAYLQPAQAQAEVWSRELRNYATTHDQAAFNAIPADQLPIPSHATLTQILDDPAMASILPSSIRPPLALTAGSVGGFEKRTPSELPPPPGDGTGWFASGESPSHWQSAPLKTDDLQPILRIAFAGHPELPPRSLRLETDAGREVPLQINGFNGGVWQRAHLFIPAEAGTVRLVAEAGPGGRWLAFTEPVEVAYGSWLFHQLRKFAAHLIWAGATLIAIGLAFGPGSQRSETCLVQDPTLTET